MAIVSTQQAIDHLRLPAETEDVVDLERKIEAAQALVIKYLKQPALLTDSPAWNDQTNPSDDQTFAVVHAAILEVLANMYQHRGDEEKPIDGPLTERVKNLLSLFRDPTLA